MTNCSPKGWAAGLSAQSEKEIPKDTLESSESEPLWMLALRVDEHSWKLSLFNAAKLYDKRLAKMAEFLRKDTSSA